MLLHYLVIILQNTSANTNCRERLEIVHSQHKAFNGSSHPFIVPGVQGLTVSSDLLSFTYILVYSSFSVTPFLLFVIGCISLTWISLTLWWADSPHLEESEKHVRDVVLQALYLTFSSPSNFSEKDAFFTKKKYRECWFSQLNLISCNILLMHPIPCNIWWKLEIEFLQLIEQNPYQPKIF